MSLMGKRHPLTHIYSDKASIFNNKG